MLWNAVNGEISLAGTKMHYVSFGRGKRPLILLPGLSDALTTVKGKALLLAKPYTLFFDRYTVYMFSRKEDLPLGYTIRDMANDQAEAIKMLKIDRACIMGVSQGGMIAQYLAADHPELVDKLILAVTAPSSNDKIRSSVIKWIACAKQGNHKELMIDTAEKSYSPSYLEKYRKLYPVIGAVGKASSYDRFIVNANAILEFDAVNELGRITCPTLIIGGEEDRIVGVQASYDMNSRIAGSKLYIYSGLGHAAYEEAEDFNERVLEFLEDNQAEMIR